MNSVLLSACSAFSFLNMPRRGFTVCLIIVCGAQILGLSSVVCAQVGPTDPRLQRPDPATAAIEGRVLLPSGRSADRNIRITLSNGQNALTTFYTDKHGEFRFFNLTEGTYYIQATGDAKYFDPVSETVRLGRGQMAHVNLALQPKTQMASSRPSSRVVSTSELSADAPPAALKEYQQAVKLVGKGRREEAIEYLLRALAIYPGYMIARNDLGAQYLKLKRIDEAEEQFRRVLATDPQHYNSQYNLGLVFLERGRTVEAVTELVRAVAIDATRPEAYLWLGVARMYIGDLASAERELTRALISGGAGGVGAHYYLAQIYLKRGDGQAAEHSLNAYLEEAPKGEYAEEARRLLKTVKNRGEER